MCTITMCCGRIWRIGRMRSSPRIRLDEREGKGIHTIYNSPHISSQLNRHLNLQYRNNPWRTCTPSSAQSKRDQILFPNQIVYIDISTGRFQPSHRENLNENKRLLKLLLHTRQIMKYSLPESSIDLQSIKLTKATN